MPPIDPAKLGRWFDAHGDSLVLYAQQWLDFEAGRDVVQDVFLRLAGQRLPPENARAWLFRAVRNAALNEARTRRDRQRKGEGLARSRQEWFEPRLADRLDAATAQELLAALPAEQREIVVLRIWGGMTLAEAAAVVGEPVSTVHHRYVKALEAIRQRMVDPCQKKNE